MIAAVLPLAVGNAVRLILAPPAGTVGTRVLRRTADSFTGPDDQGAVVVLDASADTVLDTTGLVNGIPYFYRAWHRTPAGAWIATPSVSCTPASTYTDESTDPQTVVRERLGLGLAAEIKRGLLKPASGKIPVLTTPFALPENIT